MIAAAELEDATEKNPVTPGEVIPARELLGDMLYEMGYTEKALKAYQADLENHPNRFNGLFGAGLAAEKSGDKEKAGYYYRQLSNISSSRSSRPELAAARLFLKNQ
jgi:tetratricopeptide (TPR) repeat protein